MRLERRRNQGVSSLVVPLLCSYEDDGVSTDPQLQHNVAVGAEHGEDAAFISLRAPQLHQQTELISKPKHKHTI